MTARSDEYREAVIDRSVRGSMLALDVLLLVRRIEEFGFPTTEPALLRFRAQLDEVSREAIGVREADTAVTGALLARGVEA